MSSCLTSRYSFSSQSQNSQHYLTHFLLSRSLSHLIQLFLIIGGGHQQPSSSMTAQLFPTQSVAQNDPFVYACLTTPTTRSLTSSRFWGRQFVDVLFISEFEDLPSRLWESYLLSSFHQCIVNIPLPNYLADSCFSSLPPSTASFPDSPMLNLDSVAPWLQNQGV